MASPWMRRLDPNGRVAYKVLASLHTDVRVVREAYCQPCADNEAAERSLHDDSVQAMRDRWLANLQFAAESEVE